MKTIQDLKHTFISDTELIINELNKFTSYSDEQLNWKPAYDSWSITECVSHLLVTNKLYFDEFGEQFSKKQIKTDCTKTVVKHKLISKFIIKSVDPANRKKVKTFPVFMPSSSRQDKTILQKFIHLQNDFINLVSSAENVNLNKYVMSSPASKIIKENFCDVLEIVRLHDRRHMNQAQGLLNHTNFPRK